MSTGFINDENNNLNNIDNNVINSNEQLEIIIASK